MALGSVRTQTVNAPRAHEPASWLPAHARPLVRGQVHVAVAVAVKVDDPDQDQDEVYVAELCARAS